MNYYVVGKLLSCISFNFNDYTLCTKTKIKRITKKINMHYPHQYSDKLTSFSSRLNMAISARFLDSSNFSSAIWMSSSEIVEPKNIIPSTTLSIHLSTTLTCTPEDRHASPNSTHPLSCSSHWHRFHATTGHPCLSDWPQLKVYVIHPHLRILIRHD